MGISILQLGILESIVIPPEDYTKLLLHFNGIDGSTEIIDSSSQHHSFTVVGDAQLDTAQKKFGTASLLVDGIDDTILSSDAPSGDWGEIGGGDFTVECWIRLANINKDQVIAQCGYALPYSPRSLVWLFYINSSNQIAFLIGDGDWTYIIWYVETSHTISQNVWTHIAVTRSGNTIYIFKDGELTTGYSTTLNNFYTSAVENLYIGGYADNIGGWVIELDGWIDEFRLSKGIARWTSNFTPPTEEYTS